MYSSATFAMALETGWSAPQVVSLVFFWIAFAAWLLTSPRFVHPHRGERYTLGQHPGIGQLRGTILGLPPPTTSPIRRFPRAALESDLEHQSARTAQ
jgi:hypothetical protein